MHTWLTAWLCVLPLASVQAQRLPVESAVIGRLDGAAIDESSGVAVSRAHPGVLWTHNDSGDDPILYAVDRSGRLLATYRVDGARAIDWEDIALGRCPEPDVRDTCLFVADTGDNAERRDDVVIYVVPEPTPDGTAIRHVAATHALHVRYDGGPRDAEGLAILPDGGLMLVTKGRSGPILRYTIDPAAFASATFVLSAPDTVAIAPLPLVGWITAAAVSPSGERAVLGTHTTLYFFNRTATGWEREGEGCWLGLPLRQWEAADWIDEQTVLLTSETAMGREGVIRTVRCF